MTHKDISYRCRRQFFAADAPIAFLPRLGLLAENTSGLFHNWGGGALGAGGARRTKEERTGFAAKLGHPAGSLPEST